MKNDQAVPAVSVMSDDELECVTGGTSLASYAEILVKAVRRAVGPVVGPSEGPYFGVDFDYPKRPFAQPR